MTVRDGPGRSRREIGRDGEVGSELAQAALDDVRARGLHVRPLCPFVVSFVPRRMRP